MALRENRLKKIMSEGKVALGSSTHDTRDPTNIATIGDAGADFVFIDLEHFPMSYETTANLIVYSNNAGLTPMIRVSDLTYADITRVLDAGAQAICVPHLRTPAEVERLIELTRYAPIGRRGMAMYGGAGVGYTNVTDIPATIEYINDNLLVGLNIETKEAIENLESMLVPGIDFAMIGSQDLSETYGITGQFDHPLIVDAKKRVQELCKERGIFFGAAYRDLSQFKTAIDQGVNFLMYGGVMIYIRRAVTDARAAITEATR
jgi:4-hydroxy-2-oxoheptanedioate aldolase